MNNILEVSGLCKSYRDFSLEKCEFLFAGGVYHRVYRY